MRSKEVDVAIEILKNTNFEKYSYSCKKCSLEDDKNCYTENCHNKSKDRVLNYIQELEKENKFLRDENNIYINETVSKSVIRDKIKAIENETWYISSSEEAKQSCIEELESLLGE